MRRSWRLAVALAAVMGAAAVGPAHGAPFEELARSAEQLVSQDMLAVRLWPWAATCADATSDLGRRQCLGIRAARQRQLGSRTFVVAAGPGALVASAYSAITRSVRLRVSACVACERPLTVAGQPRYVVGSGSLSVSGSAIQAPVLGTAALSFASEDEAAAWRAHVLPRLRVELVLRATGRSVQPDGLAGLQVEVVDILGFRVHDPCTGEIVAAQPQAEPVIRDRGACTAAELAREAGPQGASTPAQPDEAAVPDAPAQLTTQQIQAAMQPVKIAAQRCFHIYEVPGRAQLRLVIDASGKVLELDQRGDFVDTPTGTCIEQAARALVFPRSQQQRTSIDYPIVLR